MKLFYSPFACSLAAHIACREAGLEVDLHRVDLPTKRLEGGGDLHTFNPMGQVPTLVIDDQHTLVENSAVLTYLADRAGLALAPRADESARYELTRWLGFVGTEIHKKGLAPVFAPDSPDAVRDHARKVIQKPLGVVERHLAGREALVGDRFTVADAYLFWALTIAPHGGISLEEFPTLRAYQERLLARPPVRAAVRFERDQRERAFAA